MPAASAIKVMVVDDQASMRAMIRRALQDFGFKVLEAVVADSSLNFADDDKNVLIFDTDLAMPFAFASHFAP